MAHKAQRRLAQIQNHLIASESLSPDACSTFSSLLKIGPRTKITEVSPRELNKLLDLDPETRDKLWELARDPIFAHEPDLDKQDYRELTFLRIQKIAQSGITNLREYKTNYMKFATVFELLSVIEASMAVKYGVQNYLWGGAVVNLGSETHYEKYVDKISRCEIPGFFALTELGHGSNVRGIETTAEYDVSTQEFIINTPNELAQKFWIGNAACHGREGVVFANLHIGGKDEGVHAFIVKVRNEDYSIVPGVRIADCGQKMGLNGVDNGRLWFDRVRVPRDALLNRFADVSIDGQYSSSVANPTLRFATTIGALVGGRVCIAGGACQISRAGLAVAIRYACTRKQFGPTSNVEIPIMDYMTHQLRLIPLLARTYAYQFATNYLKERFHNKSQADMKEVHVLAAGLKAVITWHRSDTLQACRELCGGMGFAEYNRIGIWKTDVDIDLTYEGDNVVLLQQVSRQLLQEYKTMFTKGAFTGMLSFMSSFVQRELRHKNPFKKRFILESHLLDPDFYKAAFEYREARLLQRLAFQIQDLRKKSKMNMFDAWNASLDLAVSLAKAHVDRVSLLHFVKTIKRAPASQKPVLSALCSLYALSKIEENLGWYSTVNYFSGIKADAINREIIELCKLLRPHSIALVDAFAIPEHVLYAPIAYNWQSYFDYDVSAQRDQKQQETKKHLLSLVEAERKRRGVVKV